MCNQCVIWSNRYTHNFSGGAKNIIKMQITTALFVGCIGLLICTAWSEITDEEFDKTLSDKDFMRRHLRCVISQGPCDAVGRRLKTLAPLVLRGSCPPCSPKEARQIRRTLAYVQRNYPWEWARIFRQYG